MSPTIDSTPNSPSAPPGPVAEKREGHPPLEDLILYGEGRLQPEAADALREHLSHCPQCVALVLDRQAFDDSVPLESEGVSDFERAAAWRALQTRLPRRSAWRWQIAVAAAVLAAVLGLSTLEHQRRSIEELRATVTELSSPQANTPIFDLRPGAALRSTTVSTEKLLVPEGSSFTLILNLLQAAPKGPFTARLLAAGDVVSKVEGLQPDEFDTLTLMIPRDLLIPGSYTVEVWSPADLDAKTPLETYSIEVAHPL